MVKPYSEEKKGLLRVRTFESTVSEKELKWHWDEEDRYITPLTKNDWMFQFDNELPFLIDRPFVIKAGVIHRIIKGTTPLVVSIKNISNEGFSTIIDP